MDSTAIVFVIAALALGALVGWLFGSRRSAAGQGVADSLRLQLDAVREERDAHARTIETMRSDHLGAMDMRRGEHSSAIDALRSEHVVAIETLRIEHAVVVGTLRDDHLALTSRYSAMVASQEERDRAHQTQLEALESKFAEVGGLMLERAEKKFLERADQRFKESEATSGIKLKALLQPVEATLKRYEEGLVKVEKERIGTYESLREQVVQLVQHNDLVRKETQRLANVMTSSPKARGRWGEEQLKTILESAGFSENIDFSLQTTVTDGEQKLRPDCIINLPGDRCIVVDVKNVWVAFEQAYDEENQEKRSALLLQHAKAMESCASDLGRKGYWKQFEKSPDFVVMFIPGEHILSAAAERAPDMIANAARNGVLIASTINMLALSRFFAGMWRQESLAAQAQEVAAVGKELYKRLAKMTEHVSKLGRNLSLATGAYNDFVGSIEANVITQAKRFETLGIDTAGKIVESPPLVEISPRPLTKLTALSAVLLPPSANEDDAAA